MRLIHLALTTAFLSACAPGVVAPKDTTAGTIETDSTLDAEDVDDTAELPTGEDAGIREEDAEKDDEVLDIIPPVPGTVSPTDGTTAGGQFVELTGTDLGAVTGVQFCGEDAILESVEDERITLRTPEGTAGLCDVTVHTADASATLEGGFTFWEDAEGLTVAAASWTTAIFANETHWAERPEDEVRAHMAVMPAQDIQLTSLYTAAMDTCVRTDGESREDGWADFGGQETGVAGVMLDGESAELGFHPELSAYHDSFAPEADHEVGTTVGLLAEASDTAPALALTTDVAVPEQFEVITPDFHGTGAPITTTTSFMVDWTGTSAGYVGIDLWDLESDKRVRCLATDDGHFEIPRAIIDDFGPTWTQLLVTRYNTGTAELPHNRGTVQVQAGQGLIGAVYLAY